MKKGTEKIGKVIRTDYPNKGIVMTDEGTVRVACALPGQTIKCVIKKTRNGSADGILREIVERSPDEVEATCPHAGICGGCLYQTYPYASELDIKEGQVRRLLEPVLAEQGVPYEFEHILASPVSDGYRNKMEYSFGDSYKGGPLALGMHRRGSMYDIETVTGCRITDADYGQIIEHTLEYFASRQVTYYHKVTHEGYLRHLLVRRTRSGEILIALVTSSQEPVMSGVTTSDLISGYRDMLLALEEAGTLTGQIHGILHIINDSVADAVKADHIDVLYGEEFITEKLCGLEFRISTFSFFQTNTYGAEVLYGKVREYAESVLTEEDGTIYDLYSGTGTIAQIMAGGRDITGDSPASGGRNISGDSPASGGRNISDDLPASGGRHVTGVEIVEEAVEAARANAAKNGLDNCTFIAGDVLKVLDDLTEKPALIILDPPREGIHPKALPKILSYGVDHIIYVSCKTTSLAHDLETFLAAGYVVTRLCPVDQFPRTGNIETVCLLSKLHEAKHHVNVKLDMDELDLTSAEAKATYKEIEEWVQEH